MDVSETNQHSLACLRITATPWLKQPATDLQTFLFSRWPIAPTKTKVKIFFKREGEKGELLKCYEFVTWSTILKSLNTFSPCLCVADKTCLDQQASVICPCRWEVLWGFLRVHIFLLLPQNAKSMLKSCHFALCHLKWEPAVCFWIHLKSNCLAVAGSSADCGKMFSVLPL